MTQDRDELLRLLAAATPGPWAYDGCSISDFGREYPCSMSMEWVPNGLDDEGTNVGDQADRDAALIVAARNALPALLAQQQAYELRITALEAGSAPVDWQLPYRTVDAAGSPESASSVAWAWINELAKGSPDGTGYIESTQLGSDNGAIILYYGTKPYAVATVFRDVMNFAVLVRWKSPEPRALLADAPRG